MLSIKNFRQNIILAFIASAILVGHAVAFDPIKVIPDIEALEHPILTEVFIDIGGVTGFVRFKACDSCKEQKMILTKNSEVDNENGPVGDLRELKAWVNKRVGVISYKKGTQSVHNIYVYDLSDNDQ